ncbi:hypothetical protein QEV12_10475 [Trueperella pyogenes]|uniref:hypothetical protein n=1 Tax=Trueperella pyogenes TaxID=1661 RepID=UPI0024C03323|nr:hypothetical protein [Trueperella pyogenes]WHU59090.1 hypothetical protein QEV21_00200 [Trueperella pyogenes]
MGSDNGFQVNVKGLRETVRALDAAGAATTDMKDLMHEIGLIVTRSAASRVPVRSGRLARSLRAGRGKTKAVARAGSARVPYAPIIHYGWLARRIPARPFLSDAVQREENSVIEALITGLGEIIDKQNLENDL